MSGLLVASPDRSVGALLSATPVTFAADAADVEALVTETRLHRFGLAVIDDRLPGLVVTAAVRRLSVLGIGVLVLTGDVSELNHVLLRELGADDVVGRPYSPAELRARINAIMRRRTSPRSVVPAQRSGPVCLDAASRLVRVRDKNLHVAPLEYTVLLALQSRNGAPVARETLVEECWPAGVVRRPDYVDPVIRRLRVRLEVTPSSPRYLITVRQLGYALRTSDC
ncbi:MAG: response regulator transcription factor [Mycobacteriales bacterium]